MSHYSKVISLDSYDGYDFEELCAKILERGGYGRAQLTPKSGDGGKDIILTTPQGEIIYVECKHHPNTAIGRPVIQKLHSAMITGGASSGIVITSGRISTEAIDYINQYNLPIQLIDYLGLSGLATQCGIQLDSETSQACTVTGYEIPRKDVVEKTLREYMSNQFYSAPQKPENLIQFQNGSVTVCPVYGGHYDLDYMVTTTNRVLQHDTVSNGLALVDGKTGEPVSAFIRSIFKDMPRIAYADLDSDEWDGSVENFGITETTFRQCALENIKSEHSHTVQYMGRNNQMYSKSGTPSNRDIDIYNIEQIYIPKIQTTMNILGNVYVMDECYCNASTLYVPNVFHKCSVCGRHIENGVICNDCGAVVHSPRKYESHSFVCKDCGKTVCRDCTYRVGRKHVCLECAKKSGKNYVKVSGNLKNYGTMLLILASVFGVLTLLFAFLNKDLMIIPMIAFIIVMIVARCSKRYKEYTENYLSIPITK